MPAIDTQGPKKKRKARRKPGPSDVQSGGHQVGRNAPPQRTGSRGESRTERAAPTPSGRYRTPPRPVPQAPKDVKSKEEFSRAERHKRTKAYKEKLKKTRRERQKRELREPVRGREVSGPPAPSQEVRQRVLRRRLERENEDRPFKVKVPERSTTSDLAERIRQGREQDLALKTMKLKKKKSSAEKLAPVVDVLEETTRPLHAVAGGTRAAIRGENVPKAALRGIKNKDRYTFSDVLKEAGVNKKVAGPVGFVADVALDPTTYLTGGSSVAAKGATKAATKAAKKTAPKAAEKAAKRATPKEKARARARANVGDPRHQVRRTRSHHEAPHREPELAERAAARAAREDPRRGIELRVAGKRVPGVTKATSKAVPRKAAARATPQAIKRAVEEVRPTMVPTGMARADFEEVRRAKRTARAKEHRGTFRAQQRAAAYKKALSEKEQQKVFDAIEAGTTRKLPDELRRAAKYFSDEMKFTRRAERRSGVKVPELGGKPAKIPEMTADVKGAQKALRSAQAARAKVERTERRQVHKAGVAEGRARVLVGQADKRLELRSRKYKRAKTQEAKLKATGTRPTRTLGTLERERGKLYAMEQGTARARARETVREAERHLEQTKTVARGERTAQRRAQKVKARQEALPKGYVPHILTAKRRKLKEKEESTAAIEMARVSIGRRKPRPPSSKTREDVRSLEKIRKEDPEKFSENLPEIYASRMDEATRSIAAADLNRRVAAVGRRVKPGEKVELAKGEKLYSVRGADLSKVDLKEVPKVGREPGQYVVLNEDLIKRTVEAGTKKSSQLGRGYDYATGWWKFLATVPNPGFHARNLTGDTQNALIAQSAGQLVRNLGKSWRTLKQLSRAERLERRSLEAPEFKRKMIRVAGKKVDVMEHAHEAERVGAIRTGFIARELPELQGARTGPPKAAHLPVGTITRWAQNREDLLRLATYTHFKNKGLSPERAAEQSTKYHFDYSDLTDTERNIFRRIAPFYTFSARNIPLQFTSFFSKPGKFAQYEKLREEVGKYFGFDPEFEGDLSEFEQRAAPIPIKWKGKEFTISMGPSGLPLTDLNELPTSLNPGKAAEEWMSKLMSMVNPMIKSPVEIWSNFNFFFRDQLERDTGPYVAAPSFVLKLPKSVRDKMGVIPDYRDPRTGHVGPGWPAKTDYFANLLPGPTGAIERGFTRSPQSAGSKAAAYGTGVRVRPIDKISTRLSTAYDEQAKVQKQLAGLRQREHPKGGRIDADNPTPEYKELLRRQKDLKDEIEGLRVKRGDKKPKRKKLRRKQAGFETGGSGGFGETGSFQP